MTPDEHFGKPNVLVAHLKEGIEAIHLYTGASSLSPAGSPGLFCTLLVKQGAG